ncbi:GRAM domain containing protein [Trichuris trichiura]|uniref:GRAM domain containing protein n=1 Tax=Trichuris trichiura TaxID=36087 RepID=A0A077YXJ7_TRITR|nr:GRAM domain containing protein [Trichuris trichiura]
MVAFREGHLHSCSADGGNTDRASSGLSTPLSESKLKSSFRLDKKYESQLSFLAPTYKTRCKNLADYSCAYQKEILLHGRLYLSQNWLCFYSNIFRWETMVTLRYKDIVNITKERTAKIIPNAIYVITTNNDKLFFTSLSTRDKTYMMLFRLWQYALLDQVECAYALWGLLQSSRLRKKYFQKQNVPSARLLCTLSAAARFDSKCHSLNDVRSVAATEPSTSRQLRLSSDSSENDEEEVTCPCVTHEGRELMNCVYPLSVDQLFLWLFTDSEFFRQFQQLRKTKNLILSDWKIDRSTGAKLRQISYSVAVNHALAPKTCEVVEKQECVDGSKAGRIYVIKVEVQNYGIPYSDAFQVLLTYCLTRTSSSQSRLRINSKLVYRKSCWGIVKSFIEKNALFNMLNHFADLGKIFLVITLCSFKIVFAHYFVCLGKLLQFECHRLGLASTFPADATAASTVESKIDGISVGSVAAVVAASGTKLLLSNEVFSFASQRVQVATQRPAVQDLSSTRR